VRGVYAIVDSGVCERARVDLRSFAAALLASGVGAIQLRAKGLGARETLALLRDLAPPCRAAGVPLYANDRPDLALIAGADGVHVGQSDVGPADVRSLAASTGGVLRVGVSTHDEGEVAWALEQPVDYIAIGPVFGTATKANPEPTVGLGSAVDLAGRIRAARPDVARVAIGGIDGEGASALAPHFDAIAVIGALMPRGLEGDAAIVAGCEVARELGRRLHAETSPPRSEA
jgi:thiamine-phosphate pyrophosphorylase